MSLLTNHYETLLILDVSKSEEERTALIEKFKTLIEKEGAIEKVDLWGKRRLAYPINFKTEGFYVLFFYTAPPSLPRELDRIIGITDGVLRSLIIRRDERYLDVEVKLDRSESARQARSVAKSEEKPTETPEETVEEPTPEANTVNTPVETSVETTVEEPAVEKAQTEEVAPDAE